jgi:hypothetical protein
MYCNIIFRDITENINSIKFPNRYRKFNDKPPLPKYEFWTILALYIFLDFNDIFRLVFLSCPFIC